MMELACPDLDLVRDVLFAARQALEAVKRIEALAAVPGASRELVIAAEAVRERRPELEAQEMSAELVITARRAGFREGAEHERKAAAARLAAQARTRPQLRLA